MTHAEQKDQFTYLECSLTDRFHQPPESGLLVADGHPVVFNTPGTYYAIL